jgi:hypothetical protein
VTSAAPSEDSRVPAGRALGGALSSRLGVSPREAGAGVLAIGLGLFWLSYVALIYGSGSMAGGTQAAISRPWAFDLAAYVKAADRLVDTGSLYAADLIADRFSPGPADLFYYPPPLGVGMLPLRGLGFGDAALLWWVMHVAAMLLACALMPVRPVLRAIAFAVAAFSLAGFKDPLLGNVSTLLLLPLSVAWRWLDRPLGSLALAAAISVRPGTGILLVWQLLRRQWRAAGWTLVGGAALVLLTLPFVGFDGYRDFLAVLGNLEVPAGLSENRDLGGLVIAFGADTWIVGLVRAASIVAGVLAILLSLRRDREIGYMVTLTASLLLVPLLWDHYLATLVLPAALLAQRWHPALILLPLLSWLPVLSAVTVLLAIVLTLLAPGRNVDASETLRIATPDGAPVPEPGRG